MPAPPLSLFPRQKRERHRAEDAQERRAVIPLRFLAEVEERKRDEHHQRHDLLDDLQWNRRIGLAAPAIGRDQQAILEERDPPAHEDHLPERALRVREVPPGKTPERR